jgi:hypothetical protein
MAREPALSQLTFGNNKIQKNPGFGRGFSLLACSKMCFSLSICSKTCFSMLSLIAISAASVFASHPSLSDAASWARS